MINCGASTKHMSKNKMEKLSPYQKFYLLMNKIPVEKPCTSIYK